jgi:hypothetical protein
MATLPGGAHPAGGAAADLMQVDEPHAAAAAAPVVEKVSVRPVCPLQDPGGQPERFRGTRSAPPVSLLPSRCISPVRSLVVLPRLIRS